MESSESDFVVFVPSGLTEAIRWWQFVEIYSFAMAIHKTPLQVPVSSIQSCANYRIFGKDIYILRFNLRYENKIFLKVAPSHPKISVKPCPLFSMETFLSSDLAAYLRNIHRRGSLFMYIVALGILQIGFSELFDWLGKQIEEHSWFVRGSCDVACAQHFFKMQFNTREKEFSLQSLKNLGGDEFFTLLLSG
jgi:hypothetical protein